MHSVRYSADTLKAVCQEIFEKHGFSGQEAAAITDVLHLADLYGIRSHGTQRMIRYHTAMQKGCIDVHAVPETVFETPVSAVIDGHAGMGQLIALHAARLAIEKAKHVGIAFVSVRNSNHFGIAGYYTKMASDEGLIGLCTTNSESIMVHTGSKQAILGSNPLAFAMPADPYPFWFDAATTVVPKGRLEICNKADQPLHEGWAADETGADCPDAWRVLQCIDGHLGAGGIRPVGGGEECTGSHKGYGFSMLCEILCAVTSAGATSNHHVRKPGVGAGTCHAFIVIDPAIFGDPADLRARLSVLMQELRDAKRADPDVPIYTHGEKEHLRMKEILQDGIEVDVSTLAELTSICGQLGIDAEKHLGRVDTAAAKTSIYDYAYQNGDTTKQEEKK